MAGAEESGRLAREDGVMLLPAPAFAGSMDHLRVSFANVDSAGIERLADRQGEERLQALHQGRGTVAGAVVDRQHGGAALGDGRGRRFGP